VPSTFAAAIRNLDVAPGAHVLSLRVPGSYIDTQYGATGGINGRSPLAARRSAWRSSWLYSQDSAGPSASRGFVDLLPMPWSTYADAHGAQSLGQAAEPGQQPVRLSAVLLVSAHQDRIRVAVVHPRSVARPARPSRL
jgi:hypothetical protein